MKTTESPLTSEFASGEPVSNPLPTSNGNGSLRNALTFLGLTFVFSWAAGLPFLASSKGWIDVAVPPAVVILAALGPAFAAIVMELRENGRNGLRRLFRDAIRRRIGWRGWAMALGIPIAVLGVTHVVFSLLSGQAVVPFSTEGVTLVAVLTLLLGIIVMTLFSLFLAYGEELGWRGYLLPYLQTRWSALTAGLAIGVVWAIWHIPVLSEGTTLAGFALFAPMIVAFSVLYTWLYNSTGGSVLAAAVLHAGVNMWGFVFALHPTQTGTLVSMAVFAGITVLAAIVVTVVYGPETLARVPRVGLGGQPRMTRT